MAPKKDDKTGENLLFKVYIPLIALIGAIYGLRMLDGNDYKYFIGKLSTIETSVTTLTNSFNEFKQQYSDNEKETKFKIDANTCRSLRNDKEIGIVKERIKR